MSQKPTYEELEQRVEELKQVEAKRKKAEAALKDSEERLSETARIAQVGGWEIDLLGNTLAWTEETFRIHELPPGEYPDVAEAIGFYHPDDQQMINALVQQAVESGEGFDFEARLITAKKNLKWVRAIGKIIMSKGHSIGVRGMVQDITERKNAEEKLRVSEVKFRELSDMLPQIVFETDAKGNLTYANKNAFDIFGYTKDEFTSGLSAVQMISPKDREQAAERMFQIMTGQSDLTGFEYTAIKNDGTEFPVSIYSTRILRDGNLAGLRGILIDTTDRKLAEEALMENEALLEATGQMAKVGGWQLDADTLEVSWTDEIFRIYELPLGKVPPLEEVVKYFHPDDRPKLEKAIQKALEHGEPYDMEIRLITAKGKHSWTHTICEPIMENGSVVKLNGTFQDISGRKQAEIALIESEKKYQQLFLHAPAGIYEVDFTNGRFIQINSVMCDYTGYSREELLSMSPLDILTKESQDYFLERLEKFQKGKNVSATPEFCIKNKDGSTRWVQLNSQFSYKGGTAIGATVVVHDISERKRAEAELKQSEEKIARSRKMESLGLLAGGVAHDLNNVLSGIVSYPELILMDLPEDSKLREPIETIKESGQRAAAIVQDLLTVARGVAINKNPLDLYDLVGDYLHSPEFNKLQEFYPTVTFKTYFDEDLFNISGSHVHIRKAVMNLVSNAAEAIKSNGMVTISIMNRYMDRPLRGYDDVKIGEYVVLSVSDDGSGITSDDLERIFEPFYTKKVMGRSGTGLGLAVVWNIMLDHKGYIDVITDENGTTFELYFPTTREEVSGKNLSIPINNYKGNGEMILVVDDVESQRNISCRMLEKLGYQTKSVPSGEEAIEYLKENTADLMLLDMIMDPGINGRQTYEQIIKIHPKQKAIIVSGFAVTGDVKATQTLGAGEYIKKPYTIEKIGLAIQEELGK